MLSPTSFSSLRSHDAGRDGVTRVLVTRARDEAGALMGALEEAGLDVYGCPLVRVEPVTGPSCAASDFDWVVFTSRSGVRLGLPRLAGALPRVAAVGPGTAEALRGAGVEVDLVPSIHTQRGLVAALGEQAGTVLFPGAEDVGPELVEALGARHLVVYRTVELRLAQVPDADLAVLASASAARALARHRTDIPCVTIGPSTSAAADECGLTIAREAQSSSIEELVAAVILART